MDITLEMIDQIRERAGVSYEQAKKALEEADGSVVDALIALEKADKETSHEVIDTIKAMIRKGNVTKVSMKKDISRRNSRGSRRKPYSSGPIQ